MQSEFAAGMAEQPGVAGSRYRRGRRRRFLRNIGLPYLFLSPYLLLFIIFFIVPLVYAFRLSLYVTRLVGGTTFAKRRRFFHCQPTNYRLAKRGCGRR